MKVEIITKKRLGPPKYVAGLGWTQNEFDSVKEIKKDGVIVKGTIIEAEISTSGRLEPIYGYPKNYPKPPINRLYLYIDGVLEMYRLISYVAIPFGDDGYKITCEVEKD